MAKQTDVAALAAAAIAVPLAIVGQPGPYDLFDLVIGLTIAALVFGYAYNAESGTDKLQRLAVACATGLVMIPVVGGSVDFLWTCTAPTPKGELKEIACMNDRWAGGVWFAVACAAFFWPRQSI